MSDHMIAPVCASCGGEIDKAGRQWRHVTPPDQGPARLLRGAVDAGALLAYSEWLDSSGLVRGPSDGSDDRSHEQLVAEFLAERASRA